MTLHRRTLAMPRLLLSILVTAPLCAQTDAPPVRKTGNTFVVVCHGCDDTIAEQALAAVEPVWAEVCAVFGVMDGKPEQPLEVNLHRTIAGYEAAELQLTKGRLARNLAMSHWDSCTAHVAVQPPCRDEALRAVGLPAQTRALLAWEATHLARYSLCANFRDHPDWFADGLAVHVAATITAKDLPAGREQHPFWSTHVARVQRLQGAKQLPPAASLLGDTVDDLDLADRYAARGVFFAFLAEERREQLAKVAGTIRSEGGGNRFAASILAAAKSAFGKQLDGGFAKFVAAARPQWDEVYRSLAFAGDDAVQIAFADKNAIAWRTEPVAAATFAAAGRLRILPGERQQMNFLFAKTEVGFHSIAFVADHGFTVFDYDSANDRFDRIGGANAPGLRLGVGSEFRVEGDGKKLVVHLDTQNWTFELPRRLPRGITWGLGAQAGSAGIWQGVTVQSRAR